MIVAEFTYSTATEVANNYSAVHIIHKLATISYMYIQGIFNLIVKAYQSVLLLHDREDVYYLDSQTRYL